MKLDSGSHCDKGIWITQSLIYSVTLDYGKYQEIFKYGCSDWSIRINYYMYTDMYSYVLYSGFKGT